MNNNCEKIYISALDFPSSCDANSLQSAVDEAKRQHINVMVVPPKENGTPWHLSHPIKLPSYFTVILSGCTVTADQTAFMNESADSPFQTLASESRKIFILGRKGSKLVSTGTAPQIRLTNARDCRIAGLIFEGGAGIALNHLQYSKLQMLTFRDSIHAVTFSEGCNNIILESVDAQTVQESILTRGGDTRIPVRNPDIFNSIFCRIRAKTQGAPALTLTSGQTNLYNIVIRDVTDDTEAPGSSVFIGREGDLGQIRDLTVRGVQSNRTAVYTEALCDGNFYSNLLPGSNHHPLITLQQNTRELLEHKHMEIVLPQFREELPDRNFVTPNDPRFFAEGDGQTVQNAVDYASREGINCVVIPCRNMRSHSAVWILERAVRVPSYMTIVFLHCHIRHADFMYENLFTNSLAYDFEDRCMAKEEHDLCFTGVGDAVLDGGTHNGLKEKTCFLYGLPDKRLNATVLFNNVRNMVLENFQIRNSRWYGTYFIHCDTVRVSNLDFDNGEDECNRDGVDIRQGNHNFLVENITGTTGDDTVALNNLGNDGNDGRYVKGKDCDTLNMVIRNVKADAGRWFTVRLLCQDRHLEQHFLLDTIMDVSLPEDQDHPDAVVMVGSHEYHYKIPAEVGDLAHLTIRDVYSRANYGVALAGCSDDVDISNVHSYADGISVFGVRTLGSSSVIAHVRDIRADGLFYRRNSAAPDTDILCLPSVPINALSMKGIETKTPIRIENVFIDTAACGVFVSGDAEVEIKNLNMSNVKEPAVCKSGCSLMVDGKTLSTV